MSYRYLHIHLSLLAVLLAATAAFGGWADTLQGFADKGSKSMGLPYTPSEATAGIKEVLILGTDYATSRLSEPGGFSAISATTLSLPAGLDKLASASGLLSSLNNAAEDAVPATGDAFRKAIHNLSIGSDYSSFLQGGDTSITQFFEKNSRDTLKKMVRPIVTKSIAVAGVDSYIKPLMVAQQLSGLGGTRFDPVDYVTDQTLDSMFTYIGIKERDIRSSGGAGASKLLQKLF